VVKIQTVVRQNVRVAAVAEPPVAAAAAHHAEQYGVFRLAYDINNVSICRGTPPCFSCCQLNAT